MHQLSYTRVGIWTKPWPKANNDNKWGIVNFCHSMAGFLLTPCLRLCHHLTIPFRAVSYPDALFAVLGVAWGHALVGDHTFSLAFLRFGVIFSSAPFFFDS